MNHYQQQQYDAAERQAKARQHQLAQQVKRQKEASRRHQS